MLFNSYTFVFVFLPVTLLGFYQLTRIAPRKVALLWLVAASLAFYGWWRPENLLLLIVLLVLNYFAGVYLGRHSGTRRGKVVLILGLVANLGTLAYFKYADFLIETLNSVASARWPALNIVLPLGISFFIFQKLAYLVDAYRGKTRGYSFLDYCLFVTFFPQLIAGPIVHHSEVVPQFSRQGSYRPTAEDFSVGLTQFCCGLFKKVVIADNMALYAKPIFDAASAGTGPTFLDGWIATLAYSFQLYFDFSGYSDMALGLGRLFGIRLPLNFHSPYKANNIAEFWRCWHMTLSRFLRDYLYIPLGGNRKGPVRHYINLMLTMLLGGLWHGAGWNFVFWGGLHGSYLILHQTWQVFRQRRGLPAASSSGPARFLGRALTFFAVALAWVFFRASDFASAQRILSSMFGLNGVGFGASFDLTSTFFILGAIWMGVWILPNTQEMLAAFQPALDFDQDESGSKSPLEKKLLRCFSWRPSPLWSAALAAVAIFTIMQMSRVSEFIYWQF